MTIPEHSILEHSLSAAPAAPSLQPAAFRAPESTNEQFVKVVSRYIWEPSLFIREVLKVAEVDGWVDRANERLLKDHFVAIRSGNGVGKTAYESWIGYWFLFTRKMSKVVCTAVNADQLERGLWGELSRWRRESKLLTTFTQFQTDMVKMKGYPEWHIEGRTAVNSKGEISVSLQGIHAPYILYIVDECSGVPDAAIDSIESSGTGDDSYGLLCGNPTRRSGYFFNAFHRNRDEWANIHVHPDESSRMGERFKSRMLKKYGSTESNGYKIRVLGEFPTAEDTGLVSYEEYIAVQSHGIGFGDIPDDPHRVAMAPKRPGVPTPNPTCNGYVRMGVDPGGDGPESDATTFCVRKGNYIVDILSMHSLKIPEIAARVKECVGKYGVDRVCVDAIGIGKGLVEQLQVDYGKEIEKKEIEVLKVQVGAKSHNPTEYTNLRAELYYLGAQAIKNRTIQICADLPYLEEDLTGIHKSYTTSRKLYIESKDDYRSRNEGRSTDFGDAYVLTFFSEEGEVEDLPDPVVTLSNIRVNEQLMLQKNHFSAPNRPTEMGYENTSQWLQEAGKSNQSAIQQNSPRSHLKMLRTLSNKMSPHPRQSRSLPGGTHTGLRRVG